MKSSLQYEEKILLSLLKQVLTGGERYLPEEEISGQQWGTVISMAEKHGVLSLLYDGLMTRKDIPGQLLERVAAVTRSMVLQNYKLLYITNEIVHLLEEKSIEVVVLKGSATALLYPVMEYRKSGDVDVLLGSRDDINKVCDILEANHYHRRERQHSIYHIELVSKEGILVEVHTMLTEPFDHAGANAYLERLAEEYCRNIERKNILGSVLPVPKDGYHAYYLLLHMLHHFMRSGFGIKLLCDWVIFWNRRIDEGERESYIKLVKQSGLTGFSDRITAVCNHYLGLKAAQLPPLGGEELSGEGLEHFLKDILDAGEFGQSDKDRMVVIREASLAGYIREFQHQMHLNYPKAGKSPLLWPYLWGATLLRFMLNNHKVRKVSLWAVLRRARDRSHTLRDMRLFIRED